MNSLLKINIIFIFCFIYGCAQKKPSTSILEKENEFSLITVDKKIVDINMDTEEIKIITFNDKYIFHNSPIKTKSGKHSIELRSLSTGKSKVFTLDTKKGKRYDLHFQGKAWEYVKGTAWEYDRDPIKDNEYDFNIDSAYKYIADSSGLFVEINSVAGQDALKHAVLLAKKNEEIKRAEYQRKIDDLPIIKQIGQKICKTLKGIDKNVLGSFDGQTIYGQSKEINIYLTGFTENALNNKIQVRVAGIRKNVIGGFENIQNVDGETNIQINSLIWEDPFQWSPC